MAPGALTSATAGGEVVPASEYRALEAQVRELLREAVSRAAGPIKCYRARPRCPGADSVAVAAAVGVTRPRLAAMRQRGERRPRAGRRCPMPSWWPPSVR